MNPTKCTFNTRFCFASTSPLKQAEFIYSLTHYAKGTLKNCKSSLTYKQLKNFYSFLAYLLLKQAEFIYSLTHYAKGTLKNCKSSLTACTFQVSGSFSLPFLGFFSLFPHGTCALSVSTVYLDKEGGPPYIQTI